MSLQIRLVRRCLAALLVGAATLSSPAETQQSSVLPLDEAVRNPEFFVFRARLQRAVAARDTAAIMRIVSPDILNSFGGDGGREEFRQSWQLHSPDRSELWEVLGFVLALGGRFDSDTSFYAPYSMHATNIDGFEALIVLGRNVLVRAEPRGNSPIVDTVSYEAVTRWREKSGTDRWEPVRTSKGRTGWVAQEYVRSPITYRAGFIRQQGRWLLRALVAGD
jgi:hypothetical protein